MTLTIRDYNDALQSIIPWFLENIDKSQNKVIFVKLKDVQNEMANSKREFFDKNLGTFYMILKRLLLKNGIHTGLYKKEYLYISRKQIDNVNELVAARNKVATVNNAKLVAIKKKVTIANVTNIVSNEEREKEEELIEEKLEKEKLEKEKEELIAARKDVTAVDNANILVAGRKEAVIANTNSKSNIISIVSNEEREREEEFIKEELINEESIVEELINEELINEESIIEELINEESINQRSIEEELKKEKIRFAKNARLSYENKIEELLPLMKKELELKEKCFISIDNMRKFLGKEFNIYVDFGIYRNIRDIMEGYNIRAGVVVSKKGPNIIDYFTFRYKREGEKFKWEREGFFSRKEYNQYLKNSKIYYGNIENIIEVEEDCRQKDPQSLFNNKELIKRLFYARPIGDNSDDDEFFENLRNSEIRKALDMVSKYEIAIKPHIPWFKEQIEKSKDGIIRVSIKDIRKEMGEDFHSAHDTTIYSRLKDVLLEEGIKTTMGHLENKDKLLIMSKANENEIVTSADASYARHKKVAEKQGLTYAEYTSNEHYKNRGVKPQSENTDCPLYFGEYIEKKYVSQIFDEPIPFEYPKDDMGRIIDNRKPYDFICKQGFKIKHVTSCLRYKKSGNTEIDIGSDRQYWEYLIRRNQIPDYWVLSGWNNRESLTPLYVWIIKKDEIIENQLIKMKNVPFWNRDSFTIYFNKKGIEKMSQYEASKKLEQLKDICKLGIELDFEVICSNINIRAEIIEWYLTYFR